MMQDVFVPAENQLPEREGAARAVLLPQQRPLRHCLGRAGRRRVLLARRARVHAAAHDVRPPAGRDPADPEEAGRHADRDHAGPARGAAAWPADGRARRGAGDDQPAEAQQLRQGAGYRPCRPRHARRQRHRRRVPRHPPRDEPGDGEHLRGHARRACADPGPGADRAFRVRRLTARRWA